MFNLENPSDLSNTPTVSDPRSRQTQLSLLAGSSEVTMVRPYSEMTLGRPVSSEPGGQVFHQNVLNVNAPQTIKTTMPEAQAANNIHPAAAAVGPEPQPGGPPKLEKFAYSSEYRLRLTVIATDEASHQSSRRKC